MSHYIIQLVVRVDLSNEEFGWTAEREAVYLKGALLDHGAETVESVTILKIENVPNV